MSVVGVLQDEFMPAQDAYTGDFYQMHVEQEWPHGNKQWASRHASECVFVVVLVFFFVHTRHRDVL